MEDSFKTTRDVAPSISLKDSPTKEKDADAESKLSPLPHKKFLAKIEEDLDSLEESFQEKSILDLNLSLTKDK
jgi:hypothetical protein